MASSDFGQELLGLRLRDCSSPNARRQHHDRATQLLHLPLSFKVVPRREGAKVAQGTAPRWTPFKISLRQRAAPAALASASGPAVRRPT